MNKRYILFALIAQITLFSESAKANSGDFDGGVAIGSSYAGIDAAPTNGAIIQGEVGIGTSSPAFPLDLQGQANILSSTTPVVLVTRTTTGTSGTFQTIKFVADTSGTMADSFGPVISFAAEDLNAVLNTLGLIGAVRDGADNTGDLVFLTDAAGSANERMRITSGGDVGIGNTSPSYPLDVTGSMRATQALLNSSAVPTISTCGTSPPAATTGSNNNSGQFTLGTGATTACTLTFANAFPNAAFCTATPASSYTGAYYISAQSKSAFTVTLGTGTPSVKFNYTCGGN